MKLPLSLHADVAALRAAMDQSLEAWARQLSVVARKARRRTAPVLSAAVEQMAAVLGEDMGGVFVRNARLASGMVDFGGSPLPLREVMPELAARTLEDRAAFAQVWAVTGQPLPNPPDRLSMDDIMSALRAATPDMSLRDAREISLLDELTGKPPTPAE